MKHTKAYCDLNFLKGHLPINKSYLAISQIFDNKTKTISYEKPLTRRTFMYSKYKMQISENTSLDADCTNGNFPAQT